MLCWAISEKDSKYCLSAEDGHCEGDSLTYLTPICRLMEMGEFWSAVALHEGQNVRRFLQFDTQNITD